MMLAMGTLARIARAELPPKEMPQQSRGIAAVKPVLSNLGSSSHCPGVDVFLLIRGEAVDGDAHRG